MWIPFVSEVWVVLYDILYLFFTEKLVNYLLGWVWSVAFAPVPQFVCWAGYRAGRREFTLTPGRMPTTASTRSRTASASCSKSSCIFSCPVTSTGLFYHILLSFYHRLMTSNPGQRSCLHLMSSESCKPLIFMSVLFKTFCSNCDCQNIVIRAVFY